MDKLLSNRALVKISKKVQDILHNFAIGDWQSEHYHEHQNPAEHWYQMVKTYTNNILDCTSAPSYTWLLCLMYICFLLNHLATESLDFKTPLEFLNGTLPDISALLQYHFWEHVYYSVAEVLKDGTKSSFPSETGEKTGRFLGIDECIGDSLTYLNLTNDTLKVIPHSYIWLAKDS